MNVFEDLDREPGQPRMADLWAWARDDYFAGESADVVCERHRLSRSQFFERARREGWLRRDQPRASAGPAHDAAAEDAFVEDALDRPPPSAYVLYRRAWARAERALLMNRRVEAAGWTRLARDLRKLAMEEQNTLSWTNVVKASEPAPQGARGAGRPDSPDSPFIPAHPRGSGDPGLSLIPEALRPLPPHRIAADGGAAAENLGPRFRGDEREVREGIGEAERPDSPDSVSPATWERIAFKPSRRQRRREHLSRLREREGPDASAAGG